MAIILFRVTLKFYILPWENITPPFQAICIIWQQSEQSVKSNRSYGPEISILGYICGCVTLTFDLRPWPFTWISLLSIIPEILMTIRIPGTLWKLCDGQTDENTYKASWSKLKTRQTPVTSQTVTISSTYNLPASGFRDFALLSSETQYTISMATKGVYHQYAAI